jgi:hypothetical protein
VFPGSNRDVYGIIDDADSIMSAIHRENTVIGAKLAKTLKEELMALNISVPEVQRALYSYPLLILYTHTLHSYPLLTPSTHTLLTPYSYSILIPSTHILYSYSILILSTPTLSSYSTHTLLLLSTPTLSSYSSHTLLLLYPPTLSSYSILRRALRALFPWDRDSPTRGPSRPPRLPLPSRNRRAPPPTHPPLRPRPPHPCSPRPRPPSTRRTWPATMDRSCTT